MSLLEKIIDKINTRDIVTVGIAGTIIYVSRHLALTNDQFFAIAMLVLGFWFGQKVANGNKLINS